MRIEDLPETELGAHLLRTARFWMAHGLVPLFGPWMVAVSGSERTTEGPGPFVCWFTALGRVLVSLTITPMRWTWPRAVPIVADDGSLVTFLCGPLALGIGVVAAPDSRAS